MTIVIDRKGLANSFQADGGYLRSRASPGVGRDPAADPVGVTADDREGLEPGGFPVAGIGEGEATA
jgi:hypothetical protein